MADENAQADAAQETTETDSLESAPPSPPPNGAQAEMPDFTTVEEYQRHMQQQAAQPVKPDTEPPKPPEASTEPPPAEPTAPTRTEERPNSALPDPDSLTDRRRLNANGDPVKKLAFHILDGNPEISLADAEARARTALNLDPPAAPNPDTPDDGPEATETTEDAIARIRLELSQAKENFDSEREAELTEQLTDLKVTQRLEAARLEGETEVRVKRHEEEVAASRQRVQDSHPEVFQAGSPLFNKVRELTQELQGSSILTHSDFPERVVKMALAELGQSSAPKATTAPPQPPPPARPPIAGGTARSAAPVNPAPEVPPDFATVSEYDQWVASRR